MSKLGKVFMLDDDGIILDLYKEFFEAKGYDVFVTTNAYKFLLYAKEINPDVFILDVNMPTMNGWEVLQRLHQDNLLRDIPVIMLSISRDVDWALAQGAAHFLAKPLNIEELDDIIEAYCLGNKHHDILLLENFANLNSPFEQSIRKKQIPYFLVHDVRAAWRYLQKNLPRMVCVCYPDDDYEKIRKQLVFDRIVKVDSKQSIEDIL